MDILAAIAFVVALLVGAGIVMGGALCGGKPEIPSHRRFH